MAVGKNDIQKWFVNTIWMVLATKNYHLSLDTMWRHIDDEISGEVYKKSEILGKWEKRFVKISNLEGLQSSK